MMMSKKKMIIKMMMMTKVMTKKMRSIKLNSNMTKTKVKMPKMSITKHPAAVSSIGIFSSASLLVLYCSTRSKVGL